MFEQKTPNNSPTLEQRLPGTPLASEEVKPSPHLKIASNLHSISAN